MCVPNLLSWCRMFSVLPLHVLAISGEARWLAAGLIAAGMTDILDGYLARRSACVSSFGSRLDSAADNVLGLGVTAWFFILCPSSVWAHIDFVLYIVLANILPSVVGWFRLGSIVVLHTHASRLSAFCGYAVAVSVFSGDLMPGLTEAVVIAAGVTLKAIDEILILLLVDDPVAGQQPSILWYWNVNRSATLLPARNGD